MASRFALHQIPSEIGSSLKKKKKIVPEQILSF